MHQQYQGVAKTVKKPPRKKSAKKIENSETNEKEAAVKEPAEPKPKKAKGKQNMTIQPTLKNVDTQLFQTVPTETKEPTIKTEIKIEPDNNYAAMESQVLEELVNLGNAERFQSVEDTGLGLTGMKMEREETEIDESAKKKEIPAKMPGQSLLNQDLLNKAGGQQMAGLRVIKAKQTKPNVINIMAASDKVQSAAPGAGEIQQAVQQATAQIMKTENRSQEMITSTGKKIIIQASFPGKNLLIWGIFYSK